MFVHFENVPEMDFAALGSKPAGYTLLLGAKQTRLDAGLVEELMKHAGAVELIRLTSPGRNALDLRWRIMWGGRRCWIREGIFTLRRKIRDLIRLRQTQPRWFWFDGSGAWLGLRDSVDVVAGGGPAVGRQGSEGFGGLGGEGEAGEQVGEVGMGVDPGAVAVADQDVARGGAVAVFGVANEQPVFLADGSGADGVFGKVVVNLDAAVLEEYAEFFLLAEGIGEGLAGEALGQVFAPGRQVVGPGFELCEDGLAVGLAFVADHVRPGAAVAQAGFDAVEVLDLQEEPGGVFAFGFGLEKFAPDMGHAAGQLDGMARGGTLFGKAVICAVAVALEDAFEAGGGRCFPDRRCRDQCATRSNSGSSQDCGRPRSSRCRRCLCAPGPGI